LKKAIFLPIYDEFNQILAHNFFAKFATTPILVSCSKNFNCLFPYADGLINPTLDFWYPNFINDYNTAIQAGEMKDFLIRSGVEDFRAEVQRFAALNNYLAFCPLERLTSRGLHVYKFLMGAISDELYNVNTRWLTNSNSVVNELAIFKFLRQNKGKPSIAFLGRSLSKHPERNVSFRQIIDVIEQKGVLCVDMTVVDEWSAGGRRFQMGGNYSESIALFKSVDLVVADGSAGGISTHLLTSANFYILQDELNYRRGTWIDNKEFCGIAGSSIIEARKTKKHPRTFYNKIPYLDQGLVVKDMVMPVAEHILKCLNQVIEVSSVTDP
jgi:hypothetical protein